MKLRFVALVFMIFVMSLSLFSHVFAQNNQAAASKISEAESSMGQAYDAVLDAENVDADVSDLLLQLNDAAELLSFAHMAYDAEEFSEATTYAESARAMSYEATVLGEQLEVKFANMQASNFQMLLIISVIGVSVVIVGSFVGYRFFKKRYFEGFSKDERK